MLLAALSDEPGGGGGVTWQQGTFDPTRYGEMFVNGKLVRSGPSASGDSFWDQSATPPEERSIVTIARDRTTPAPQFKSVQDSIVQQYVPQKQEPGILDSIASVVSSVTAPLEAPVKQAARTEYVTRQPSYYNLDSIMASFIGKPQPQTAQPVQQRVASRSSPVASAASSLPSLAVKAATLFSPLEFPKAQPARSPVIIRKSSDPMITILIMVGVGAALLGGGVLLMNRK